MVAGNVQTIRAHSPRSQERRQGELYAMFRGEGGLFVKSGAEY